MYQQNSVALSQFELVQRSFIAKVYGWMFIGLFISGIIAVATALNPALVNLIILNRFVFYALLIAELALVWIFSATIHKMTLPIAMISFIGYSALNGLTLSVIFLLFTASSIGVTFFVTAGTFGVMSIYGYITKTDLTSIGNFLIMGLIGVIIASVVNIFFFNEMFYWIITYAGIAIFMGLTAYDTQKIKNLNIDGDQMTDESKKMAIFGALILYLDFINLFLFLLRIFGRRK